MAGRGRAWFGVAGGRRADQDEQAFGWLASSVCSLGCRSYRPVMVGPILGADVDGRVRGHALAGEQIVELARVIGTEKDVVMDQREARRLRLHHPCQRRQRALAARSAAPISGAR